MNYETLFFAVGIALAVLAVAVSILGIKSKNFPSSNGLMLAVVAVFAALVVTTAFSGWQLAAEEKEHREHEQALEHGE